MMEILKKVEALRNIKLNDEELKLINEALEQYRIGIKSYTDLATLFSGGKHALLIGMTGSGKTTLLYFLLDVFLKRGYKVIYRDDTGLEFLLFFKYLSECYDDILLNVYYPNECKFIVKEQWDNLYLEAFDWCDTEELVFKIMKDEPQKSINVIVFDKFNPYPELSAKFWSDFFLHFILYVSDLPFEAKQKIVLSLDELNDIIQSNQAQLTEMHGKLRGLFEYNLRKVRKHKVTILATTHRMRMMTRNSTSQFAYNIVKQSEGADIYDFLNRKLIAIKSKTFWAILHDIITLEPHYFYLFDYKGNFDKITFPDILAPYRNQKINFIARGRIRRIGEKQIRMSDLLLVLYRLADYTFDEISEILAIPKSTLIDRYSRLLEHDKILDLIKQINPKKLTRKFRHTEKKNRTTPKKVK